MAGEDRAIAEVPTPEGPADYVLFRGLVPLAVVEAKRKSRNVRAALHQAERYARSVNAAALESWGAEAAEAGPWADGLRIPFFFATNGMPFQRTRVDRTGVWFQDARSDVTPPRALERWYTPDGLRELARRDLDQAHHDLAADDLDGPDMGGLSLRDYQEDAVRSVEGALIKGQREILLAMATGTGKTRTALALIYRLLRHERFRRILFLVDRNSLGEQAYEKFEEVKLADLQSLPELYDVRRLGDLEPRDTTRVHIATVQAMVRRIFFGNPEDELPVDAYDCIVVDECHRGYHLDREVSDEEMVFRNLDDYISKYRRVLDHFDAVRIGLTATPALHTTEIFGAPVKSYSYRDAVLEGWLVDHEPPVQIETQLSEDGIHWEVGEAVEVYEAGREEPVSIFAPDEIDLEIDDFNRRVETEEWNRVVCEELARHVDPTHEGKTLVFCCTDVHADMVVRLLDQELRKVYPDLPRNTVRKITGQADRPQEAIRRFKNERLPNVAVTVDLLSTGIDVPEIAHVVFLRRVKSRILYEQMMGRATRRCENLYGPGLDKEVFYIYDAVRLYESLRDHTDIKPVVANPKVSFGEAVENLLAAGGKEYRGILAREVVGKLRRLCGRIERYSLDEFEALAGGSPDDVADRLAHATPDEVAEFFRSRPELVDLLDFVPSETQKRFISHHPDQVRAVTRGYGDADRPEDYLRSFQEFLERKSHEIPALLVVTQRPRDLTRRHLMDLKKALDAAGFSETALRTAWREMTNEDLAASVLGFVRQQALGDPLIPYSDRVNAAKRRILASRNWTRPQRQWIENLSKQLEVNTVIDVASLDEEPFRRKGGLRHLDRVLDGQAEEILGDLKEEVWKTPA